jgi:type I restriction enzyme R subunit
MYLQFEWSKGWGVTEEAFKIMISERLNFSGLPSLNPKGLRACQYEAITELEKSFRNGQNRALMVLAIGAGKTYTACLASYRMLPYTPMRRVLFLVDRNNLGKQAEGEFGTFRLTENGDLLKINNLGIIHNLIVITLILL